MKYLTFLTVFFITLYSYSQTKYITKTGQVSFEASVPSFEEVKADHKSVTAIINADNGEFAALVLVKGFRFKNALMEEHFNENYAESEKYPKATFKGKIVDFSVDKIKNTKTSFSIKGALSFHGETVTIENTTVDITLNGNELIISGNFLTSPADFNIEIPKVVRNKVAKNINVSYNFNMSKK